MPIINRDIVIESLINLKKRSKLYNMKKFIKERLKHLGIERYDFMQKIGVKRDLHSKVNTMENKLRDLNDFFEHLECDVIIVSKNQYVKSLKQVYPEVD